MMCRLLGTVDSHCLKAHRLLRVIVNFPWKCSFCTNNSPSCLAPERVFVSSRETVGLWPENDNRNLFIARVTAGDDYYFFLCQKEMLQAAKCAFRLIRGRILGKNSSLFLSALIFLSQIQVYCSTRRLEAHHIFCSDRKPCKICMICFTEEAGEIPG